MTVIGVLLSGAGVLDGSEIHETVLAALHLEKRGAKILFMAPDLPHAKVVDHLTGKESGEQRGVLEESARIARGKIKDVSGVNPEELDGLVLPGGSGVALNLTNFAQQDSNCKVEPATGKLITAMLEAKKPVGALCLAPVVLAAVCRDMGLKGVRLTIGDNRAIADSINKMGSTHVDCHATGTVVDLENQVATTPAYMLAQSLAELDQGIGDWAKAYLALFTDKD